MMQELKVDGITFNLREYSGEIQTWISKANQVKLVERIWKRDHTLWKPDPTEIGNRLGWLDVATRIKSEIPVLQAFAREVKRGGIGKVLLLGMGGSSLAPELFSKVFSDRKVGLPLEVLDSTDPQAVSAKDHTHRPKETLYIVSSKSGSTVETSSLFKYFYNRAAAELGAGSAGAHFVAITDPGSSLAQVGAQLGFRRIFLADADIGGRYSALSHFGLVPAALIGVDLVALLDSAENMAARCKNSRVSENPGALLGIALGCLAAKGRDKATFVLPAARESLGDWVEQLLAESTGKEGKGIVPIVSEPKLTIESYAQDRLFVAYSPVTTGRRGHPTISLSWQNDNELGAQFFLWEFATAVAGWVLGINPFDQPNVEEAKVRTLHFLAEYNKVGKLPKSQAEPLNAQTLDSFLSRVAVGSYIALQAYAAPNPQLTEALQGLREKLASKYKLATTLGYGPRFLHSTGQLHKGDGGRGFFVQFVALLPPDDLPIPNEAGIPNSDLAFGVLKFAQALGDAEALQAAKRQVLTFQVPGNLVEALQTFGKAYNGEHG